MSTTRTSNRELWSGVARGVVTIVAVVAVLVAAAAFIVPRLMGWVPLTILSGSMEPTYSPGDVVVVDPDYEDPVVGDVVTVQPVSGDPTLVTHRIIGVTIGSDGAFGITTQGDANETVDDPVAMEQVQGRVLYGVPWVGHLTQPEVRPWLGGAAIAVVVWVVISSLIGGRKKDGTQGGAHEATDGPGTPPAATAVDDEPTSESRAPGPTSPAAAPATGVVTADEADDDEPADTDARASRRAPSGTEVVAR